MDDPLANAQTRLTRYWNVDGLHEIGVAVIFGLTAAWVWAGDLSALPRPWKNAFSATFPILLLGGMFVERVVVKLIRRRLTYPRAGFAELRRPPRATRLISAAAAGLIAALIAAAAAKSAPVDLSRWAVLAFAVGLAAILWFVGARAQLARFQAIAALLAVTGLALAVSGLTLTEAIVAFWAVAAALFLTSGVVTLWRFLRA